MSTKARITSTVANMIGWGRSVVAAVDAHGGSIAQALDGRSGLDEAEWNKWLVGQRTELALATDELLARAMELARERGDDFEVREARDQAQAKAYGAMQRTRDLLDSIDERQAPRFGLRGTTPKVSAELVDHGRNAVEHLREADTTLVGIGVEVETVKLADQLEPMLDELWDRLEDVERERREEDVAMVARDRAMGHWSEVYQSVANMIEGAFRMAGEKELSEKVRPSIRRATGEDSPEEDIDDDLVDIDVDEPVEA